jgi:hypothetical protein
MKSKHIAMALIAGLALLASTAFAAPVEAFTLAHGLMQFDMPSAGHLLARAGTIASADPAGSRKTAVDAMAAITMGRS